MAASWCASKCPRPAGPAPAASSSGAPRRRSCNGGRGRRRAPAMHERPAERPQAIATKSEKAPEPAFPEVARRLSVDLVACTVMDLDRVAGQVRAPSEFLLEV